LARERPDGTGCPAPPQVYPLDPPACGAHLCSDIHHPSRRLCEGCGLQDLRADMAVQPHRPDAIQLHGPGIGLCHLCRRYAELGGCEARGDLWMGPWGDIGIDPEEYLSLKPPCLSRPGRAAPAPLASPPRSAHRPAGPARGPFRSWSCR